MIGFDITEEQEQLVQTARDFTKKEIIPVAGHLDEEGKFPDDICKRAWETGPDELRDPGAVRRPGAALPGPQPADGGDLLRLRGHQHHRGRQRAGGHAADPGRHRRAEEGVLRAPAGRPDLRRLLLLRARRRVGRGRHEEPLPQGGRRLRADRPEALDHQRRGGQLLHRVRPPGGDRAAQGHHLLRGRPRGARGVGGQEREQDGPAGLEHHRRHLRGREADEAATSSGPRARASRWR